MAEFAVTATDLIALLPVWILAAGALLLLMLEVYIKSNWPRAEMAAAFLALALGSTLYVSHYYYEGAGLFNGILMADPFTLFFTELILAGSLLSVLLSTGGLKSERIESLGEYYCLLLCASLGAILFAAAGELITMFLSLEIMSMALYCLCGSAISLRCSTESALKYFLLGSFSSAFLLYGIAIIYGVSGSTEIVEINSYVATMKPSAMLYVGMAFLLIGFAFKISAVPFHFWAPDVYQGAPTSVTAYMACVVKAAAVAALLRGMWSMFREPETFMAWSYAVWLMAVLTMSLGNLAALRQRSLKRMLAYSSIAHVGYVLVAVLAPEQGGGAAILFYLVSYTVMTLGAFGVVMAVTRRYAALPDSDDISRFRGLGFSRPLLGVLMALFMFSLAGLPPGMAGMFGKFYLFNAAVQADYIGIVIIGVLNSAISCAYYLRVLVVMYFEEGDERVEPQGIHFGFSMASALGICAFLTLGLGVFAAELHAVTSWAASGM